MKKTIMNIRTMAALLIASAAFTACSNEDGAVIGDQPAATQTPQVYTLTLQAANATGAQHRALELDGTKLVAKWAAGDELTVINVTSMNPLGGTLTASNVSADGKTCTFSGTLTGTIEVGNQLALHYHATSGTQDGTLESAAASDQANAIVTVASFDEGNITISESEASFNTTTAVLKLTLKDGSANALNATSLKMTVDGVDIFTASPTAATYTTNDNGVLYFAVPEKFDAAAIIAQEKSGSYPTPELIDTWMTNLNTYDVTFTATVGSDTYTATKTGYKLAAGKYYATELTMAKPAPSYDKEMDLSTAESDVNVPEGEHWLIKGYAEDICVTIGNGATVTLNGVEFFMNDSKPCIKCSGDATIILADGATNTLTATGSYSGGILAGPTGKTLTIKGNTGVLNVAIDHTTNATAIGAYNETACGDIVIEGGVINATSQNGAAIGACYQAACGNITISGGTVTAKAGGAGDYSGVGIGGHYNTACGNIKITGGTVTATGFKEPGIGGDNRCGDITISGGTVKATKGELADMCIGIGNSGTCGTITIGGTVYWDGSNYQNDGGSYLTQDQIIYPTPAP